MEDKTRKLKAAITGVLYFLQQEEQENTATENNTWLRSSRETIMQNRIAVQARSFGLGWQRK